MLYLYLFLILSGAMILAASIWRYYRVLANMKRQIYEKKIFNNWIYGASFVMMIFFFIGYICVGILLLTGSSMADFLLVSLIFFFGAIFVWCMVSVQQEMTETIMHKTLETIQSLIDSMEAKDIYTRGHSEHVYRLVELFYNHFPDNIKNEVNFIKLKDAAMLHDIGKIGIPDGILNKPDKLLPEEMQIIKQHPLNGKFILEKTTYREICDLILYHHERIDGKGYYNIPENAIPLESKIIAIADTFSALYTDRVYRKKFSYDEAITILCESAGTQLDSTLVGIFCNISEDEINSVSVSSILSKS